MEKNVVTIMGFVQSAFICPTGFWNLELESNLRISENLWSYALLTNKCMINSLAQSICTHYSCFEKMGRFVTLEKIRSKIWTWKKQVAKNRVIVIQKENRQPGLFSFWITMTLFFAPCFFEVHILDLIFLKLQILKKNIRFTW